MKKNKILARIKAFLSEYIEDLLIFCGIFFIVYATFRVNETAGFYCLGGFLLGLGMYFTKNPIRKG